MSLYTIVFIGVTLLVIIALAAFGLLVGWLDKKIDRKERLGKESIIKKEDAVKKNE